MPKAPALLFAACTLSACAQSASDAAVLARLAANSAAYRDSLPSFNCEENIVATTSHEGKVDWRVDFTATLRVHRNPRDGALSETYSLTSYLGRPLPDAARPRIPIYVQGGFGKGVPSFFTASQQACYRYTVNGNRVNFTGLPGASPCNDVHATTGFALLDSDGNITHGETRLPLKEAARLDLTTFASVDYDTITLDGRPFHLPVHLYAEKLDGKELYTFDAHYTNCKLFHATVTIVPGPAHPVDTPQP